MLTAWQTGAQKQVSKHSTGKTRQTEIKWGVGWGQCGKCSINLQSSSEALQDKIRMVSLLETISDRWKKGQEKTQLLPCPRLNPEPFSVNVCGPQAAFSSFQCAWKHIGYIWLAKRCQQLFWGTAGYIFTFLKEIYSYLVQNDATSSSFSWEWFFFLTKWLKFSINSRGTKWRQSHWRKTNNRG